MKRRSLGSAKSWPGLAAALVLCIAGQLIAQEVDTTVPRQLFVHALDTLDGLEIQATTAMIIEEDWGKAIELEGLVLVPDLEIEDVGIEVEILAPSPCYPGIVFRFADAGAYELAYGVPAASGQSDAIQYDPVFNRSNTWQLYTGPAYQKQATVPLGEWFTLRIDVVGERAAIRVGDQPPLVVEHLAHGRRAGRVGLWTFRPARFRNLRVMAPESLEHLSGEHPQAPEGSVDAWWLQGTGTVTSGPSGVLNLNRYIRCPPTEVRLVRHFTLSDESDLDLAFGYSDDLRLSLDGQLLFEGSHTFAGFESRDARGWVRPENNRLVHRTGAGRHELEAVLRVSEPFGWGLLVTLAGGEIRLLPAELTNVRTVNAGPLRVVAFRAQGTEPEASAFEKLRSWAEPRGLLADRSSFLLLGRNDPPPAPGRPDYGYVYMLTIPDGLEAGGGVEIIEIPQATYLVVRARLSDMGTRWEALYRWAESSGFTVTGHGLEEHLNLPGTVVPEEMVFDLWLPITGTM